MMSVCEFRAECMDSWMDEWMDGWMDGQNAIRLGELIYSGNKTWKKKHRSFYQSIGDAPMKNLGLPLPCLIPVGTSFSSKELT